MIKINKMILYCIKCKKVTYISTSVRLKHHINEFHSLNCVNFGWKKLKAVHRRDSNGYFQNI